MARIQISANTGNMGAWLTQIPAFPGENFGLGFPEAIGDIARGCWFNNIRPEWRNLGDGVWEQVCRADGELSYAVTLIPGEDFVDARLQVTNESDRNWTQSFAFNCFQAGGAPSIRDNECVRHWCRTGGEFKRLVELPRKFGPRPTIQLYSVEGALPGMDIPFVANFQSTPPDVALEGWLAIESRDGKRLVATVSRPALFLFQNMEYSCIHSAPSFGPLKSGETGEALTRVYFVESSVEEWHGRMGRDLGA